MNWVYIYIYIFLYIYIYIYREREYIYIYINREREREYICIYIFIYIYIEREKYICMYIQRQREREREGYIYICIYRERGSIEHFQYVSFSRRRPNQFVCTFPHSRVLNVVRVASTHACAPLQLSGLSVDLSSLLTQGDVEFTLKNVCGSSPVVTVMMDATHFFVCDPPNT